MADITFKGDSVHTLGSLPEIGSQAPDFSLAAGDFSDKSLADYTGQVKILNIVPSLDTSVCATSTRRFNEEAAALENAVVLVISSDLPFAQGRFCEAEGIEKVIPLSTFRSSFASDYQVEITDSPLKGLVSRAVVVIDSENVVRYVEQVPEIAQEPDYKAALAAAKDLS